MTKKCCVPNCKVQSDDPKGRHLSFFMVPADEKTKKKWSKALSDVGVQELKKYTYVCSLHFGPECFYYSGLCQIVRLAKGSYPTIFTNHEGNKKQCSQLIEPEQVTDIPINNEKRNASPVQIINSGNSLFSSNSFQEHLPEDSDHQVETCEVNICDESVIVAETNDQTEITMSNVQSNEQTLQQSSEAISSPNKNVINKQNNEGSATKKIKRKPTHVSISNIDLDSIDYSSENLYKVKDLLRNAKEEVNSLRRRNRTLQMKAYRWKKGVKNLGSLIKHVRGRKYINEKVSEILTECVPAQARSLFKRLLCQPKSKASFPLPLRSFATTLQFYSPKAYNYVRKCFMNSLPHPVTISKWHQKINVSSGINKLSINAIKRKVESVKEKNKNDTVLCNLVMDEMKVNKHVELVNGKEYGYVDVGNEAKDGSMPQAKNVLVVMLVCVNGNWKIPVSFYFIDSLKATEKARIVRENLAALHETGVTITSLTFDGLQSNTAMCKELGAEITDDISKPIFFCHPISRKPVFIIYDGCHCLKLVRNSIATGDLYDADGNLISWRFFELLVDYQEKNGVHPGTTIRREHLNWEQNKMNVKLAAQTLSGRTSTGLLYLKNDEGVEEFENAEGTAKFCSVINEAFDILNSRELYNKNPSKVGISESNIKEVQEKTSRIIQYISGLIRKEDGTLITKSSKKTGFVGMIVALQSVLAIYETYVKPINGYLLTYKLSQDHLENYFSAVRSKGGHNNNPTCYQFIHIFKRLLVHADVKESEHANCMSLDDTTILKVSSEETAENSNESVSPTNYSPGEDLPAFISSNDPNFYGKGTNKTYIDNVVGYLTGFVTRHILKRSKCFTCPLVITSETSYSRLLDRKNRGGLILACKDVIEICKIAEKNFREFYISRRGISVHLLNLIQRSIPNNLLQIHHSDDPVKHRYELIKKIIYTFLRVRIHYYESNKRNTTKKVRRVFTKLILFRNE